MAPFRGHEHFSNDSYLPWAIKQGARERIEMVQSNITRLTVLEEVEKIPPEYLPFLLEIMRAFRESITLKPAEKSFRQGWQEALRGETRPVSELWKDIDAG
jgi:hypothetical protein